MGKGALPDGQIDDADGHPVDAADEADGTGENPGVGAAGNICGHAQGVRRLALHHACGLWGATVSQIMSAAASLWLLWETFRVGRVVTFTVP